MTLLVSLTFHLFIVCLQKVEDALQKGTDFYIQGSILEEDPEYQVIVDCNALSVDIENEMLPQKKTLRKK
jgi:U4/U6 small nuclear ribonucleoprotein PRP31